MTGCTLFMKIIDQPKIFVIRLPDTNHPTTIFHNRNSFSYYSIMLESLEQYKYSYEMFPAVEGWSLKSDFWIKNRFQKLNKNMTPGEIGCFVSHFLLWQKALRIDENIIILEHDVIAVKEWAPLKVTANIMKLNTRNITTKKSKLCGIWHTGAYSYLISPAGAKILIKFSQLHGPIPVDKIIGSKVIDWTYGEPFFILNKRSLVQSSTRK